MNFGQKFVEKQIILIYLLQIILLATKLKIRIGTFEERYVMAVAIQSPLTIGFI